MPIATKTEAHPPVERCWFVVNMSRRWKAEGQIERQRKPTKVWRDLSQATAEAHRLAALHPRWHYAVFECIGYVKADPSSIIPDAVTEPPVVVTEA